MVRGRVLGYFYGDNLKLGRCWPGVARRDRALSEAKKYIFNARFCVFCLPLLCKNSQVLPHGSATTYGNAGGKEKNVGGVIRRARSIPGPVMFRTMLLHLFCCCTSTA